MEKISMKGMKCSSCCKPQDPWMWATDTLLWTVCPKQASSQPWKSFPDRDRPCSLSAEPVWGMSLGNLLGLPQGILHSLCSLKTREPCGPFSCSRTQLVSQGHHSVTTSGKIMGRHLSTQGEEWFLCPHSLPSSVTPWKLTSVVQSAPSWAAGLEPPSNSTKGALGQKEIVWNSEKVCPHRGTRFMVLAEPFVSAAMPNP